MIINEQKKIVFVHIPKTAGTSIMLSLQSEAGNNVRWLANTKHETLHELYSNSRGRLSTIDRLLGRTPVGYFSFAFVRNPWDRMASLYRYLCEKTPRAEIATVSSFKDFLIQAKEGREWILGLHSMRQQVDYFSFPDGRMAIDFLGHFEHLEEDILSLSLCINFTLGIGKRNQSSNTGRDYRLSYDSEMVEVVRSLFLEDCVHFGYEFEQRYPTRRCSGRLDSRR